MNPWRTILLHARPGLITLGGAIVIALVLAIGSGYLKTKLRAELEPDQGKTRELRATLDARQADLTYVETHIALFRTLQKQGLTSPPDREGWVEHLLAARRDLRLPDNLLYALPPPKPIGSDASEGAPAASGGEPGEVAPDTPLSYDLEISLRDIHEAELLALFKRLQNALHERFRVQSCRLSSPAPTGLRAECTLRFFTLPAAPSTPDSALH